MPNSFYTTVFKIILPLELTNLEVLLQMVQQICLKKTLFFQRASVIEDGPRHSSIESSQGCIYEAMIKCSVKTKIEQYFQKQSKQK